MKISIITPVYNRADCVARCIESVIHQKSFPKEEYEHIIVNDGSIDDTDNIVKKYSDRYSNIEYISFNNNRGTNAARNAAIQRAKGDYCIILDSDDYLLEDALNTICTIMQNKPGYKHYMFTPDDRKSFFDSQELLKKEKIFTFKDFLLEKYNGDFMHVIDRNIMLKHPFEESLRIFEGIFFLKFYKEAQNIYFTNIVVAIRERGREDSVSKEYIRINKKSIEKLIKATEIKIDYFKNEYLNLGATNNLNNIYMKLLDNYLLLGDYKNSSKMLKSLDGNSKKIIFYKLIHSFRLGAIYRILLFLYLRIKYCFVKIE